EGVRIRVARVPAFIGGPVGKAQDIADAADRNVEIRHASPFAPGEPSDQTGLQQTASGERIMRGLALAAALTVASGLAAFPAGAQQWVASWTGWAHGRDPIGNPTAQPELKFAFPVAEQGANDQTFRLIVRPDIWGNSARIRLSNVFGARPVTFDDAFIGL